MDCSNLSEQINSASSQLGNTSFYNVSIDNLGQVKLVTTYSKIFESMQSSVLTSILYGNIFFLLLSVSVIESTKYMEPMLPTWGEILDFKAERNGIKIKILRSIAWISFPLSLFSVLLLISVKLGLNW